MIRIALEIGATPAAQLVRWLAHRLAFVAAAHLSADGLICGALYVAAAALLGRVERGLANGRRHAAFAALAGGASRILAGSAANTARATGASAATTTATDPGTDALAAEAGLLRVTGIATG